MNGSKKTCLVKLFVCIRSSVCPHGKKREWITNRDNWIQENLLNHGEEEEWPTSVVLVQNNSIIAW